MTGPGDLAGLDRTAIQCGDDADHVRLDALERELAGRHAVFLRIGRRDHREQRGVDAIGAGGEDAELAAFLAAVEQELARILEVVAIDDPAQDAFRGMDAPSAAMTSAISPCGTIVTGALRIAVLPAEIAEMQPGRERVGLVTGFAVERDQPSGRQASANRIS